jgi:hypothetical protein
MRRNSRGLPRRAYSYPAFFVTAPLCRYVKTYFLDEL